MYKSNELLILVVSRMPKDERSPTVEEVVHCGI
jgi:hypothetical protein